MLSVMYPLYYCVIASFSDPAAIYSGRVIFWPADFTLAGYERIFDYPALWNGYMNTILYVVFGTVLALFLTMTVAYPLSRKRFSVRGAIMTILVVTMYFSGGLIPLYLVVKQLGLINTRFMVMLSGAVSVYNVILTRTFMESAIPTELEEAAEIDGCNHFRFFWQVVLPLSPTILAVLALYYGVAKWNDYWAGLIYITDEDKRPLQLVLRSVLYSATAALSEGNQGLSDKDLNELRRAADIVKYGIIIVSSVPVLCLYPFLQKYFIRGVLIGSIKG